jgi:hypothetical protein
MVVSGELEAPATLYPWGRNHQYSLVRRLGGHQSWSRRSGEEKYPVWIGIEPWSSSLWSNTILSYPMVLINLYIFVKCCEQAEL